MSVLKIKKELKKLNDPQRAKNLTRFFKTGKGQYGEGDKFLGITVPEQRKIACKYRELELKEIEKLLQSPYHEHRLTALIILVMQVKKSSSFVTRKALGGADDKKKKEIYNLYLKNYKYVNNWDLVDLSAPNIVGGYLIDKTKERQKLYTLANSKNLWKKRIAIISTAFFINKNDFDDALKISKILLNDKHDLIHKAVGWMLREVGKRDIKTLENFLKKHYKKMPRTMLRYAIEKFPETKRKMYLRNEI